MACATRAGAGITAELDINGQSAMTSISPLRRRSLRTT
jgi:hypothetical protein